MQKAVFTREGWLDDVLHGPLASGPCWTSSWLPACRGAQVSCRRARGMGTSGTPLLSSWHTARRCLGWGTGAAPRGAPQHPGKLQGRNCSFRCLFSLASSQSSEQSCQSTTTTAFHHGKLELSQTMFNSRPTGFNILVSRKLGNYIPAI